MFIEQNKIVILFNKLKETMDMARVKNLLRQDDFFNEEWDMFMKDSLDFDDSFYFEAPPADCRTFSCDIGYYDYEVWKEFYESVVSEDV